MHNPNLKIHSLPTSFFAGEWGGGVEPPTKFSKRGGLARTQLLEGVAGKEGGNIF